MHADSVIERTPVVVLTSSNAAEGVVRAHERCANGNLTKPAGPDEFVETVRSVERFWLTEARVPDESARR